MVFSKLTNFLIFPIYYIIHKNIIFGYLYKKLIKNFYYKNYKFNINKNVTPTANYSSFLFKTYELNDRYLIEKHITKNNKCIIIGGGIGFISTLAFKLSQKKILVFEINKKILPTLKKNLKLNKCKHTVFFNNLKIGDSSKISIFYLSNDFLATSSKIKTLNKIIVKNINYSKVDRRNSYNTLIIDAEGDEEYYINSLKKLKNIEHLFFELHYNLFSKKKINKLMKILKNNNFYLRDKFFNSFYFSKDPF